ncbi:enoyl-CoA hydratase/isomerase family protein [Nocardia transvalensis]|uniref:enoyl-CoA hydratase/isomerase family protein n=1 Tax=Nocardia transvalensis TaxID=37333 RepID=UPI0018945C51|nr:enoyl-CoA hydratase/isomerase family protein [Nocardia transvalensis]MBF6328095.1 enoyl-CoA hydratase/isomerase family protein [Nocardia transvalensis]
MSDGVAWATFDNPPINLVTPQLYIDLGHLLDQVDSDDRVRVIVFESAASDFFLAHWDMTAVGAAMPSDMPPAVELMPRLAALPKVTIAKIAGRARGAGSELALACDMRFASTERAILGQPEITVGLLPGGNGTQRLPGLLGRGRALEAILSGDDFPAPLAERYGWINRAVPDAELDEFVDRLARRIASFPPHAITAAKAMVDRITLPDSAGLAEESRIFQEWTAHPEVAERVTRLMKHGLQTHGPVELDLGRIAVDIATGKWRP